MILIAASFRWPFATFAGMCRFPLGVSGEHSVSNICTSTFNFDVLSVFGKPSGYRFFVSNLVGNSTTRAVFIGGNKRSTLVIPTRVWLTRFDIVTPCARPVSCLCTLTMISSRWKMLFAVDISTDWMCIISHCTVSGGEHLHFFHDLFQPNKGCFSKSFHT